MKKLLLVFFLLWAGDSYAYDRENWFSTRGIRVFGQALTDGGIFGAPRYTTALLPTCNTGNTGGLAYDTTAGSHVACNGSAWATVGGFSGGTVAGATLFTARVTFGTAADAANAVDLNETAGCITFEGSGADTSETRLCASNPGSDFTVNVPGVSGTLAVLNANQTLGGFWTFGGQIYWYSTVEAVTVTKTPSVTSEGNEIYTNTGDADGATITLPDNPTAGAEFHFAVTAAQTLTIVPSTGETLFLGADGCVVSITSNTVGSTLTIKAAVGGSGGVWMSFGSLGTWVCNDV